MIHRFGEFELDEERRELRLRGRERLLQPRVFDLLVYLVRQRERVVGKDELLDALWPEVTVTEGSLQRVVSLARAALRDGGVEDGIRTFHRQGYRFTPEVMSELRDNHPAAGELPSSLAGARRSFEQGDWERAAAGFRSADDDESLQAPDLERWARAATFAGRSREAIGLLERASAAHAAAGDARGGARVALLVTQLLFENCEPVVAKGWFRRAATLLEAEPEIVEHGHLEWVAARFALSEGDHAEAARRAALAREIGHRTEDGDLDALGLLYGGHALLSLGDVQVGVAMLDEAAAAVIAGSVSSWSGGLVYCGVIWACRNRGDWQRASQWTDRFTRWCESKGLDNFPGTCRLHRAEVLGLRGELTAAEQEANDACERLSTLAPWAHGDAYRVLGNLYLSRGELDRAERAFRRAHELGWDPQPGHALVLAQRGEFESATRYLKGSLEDPGWSNREQRGRLLAHLAIIAARAGKLDEAAAALRELGQSSKKKPTPESEALKHQATGELLSARGEMESAVPALRRAIRCWTDVGAPLRVAEIRLRLAKCLAAVGDRAAAEIELGAVTTTYAERNLPALLERCEAIRRSLGA